MKLKKTLTALLMAVSLMWVSVVQAATTTFKGVSVDYGSASTNWVGGELVLTYKNVGSDSLKISDGAVNADILVVGGGGAGGTGRNSTSSARYGNGGDGGEVVEKTCLIPVGALTINVGGGGTVTTASNANGGAGNDTTIESTGSSFAAITAKGGAGGSGGNTSSNAKAGSPTQGVTSEIDGKTYGKGGAKYDSNTTAANGDSNTGNGGQGGRANSNANARKGGDGGSGVVVVRLKEAYAVLEDLGLRIGGTVSEFRDASDQPISFAYSDVTCRSSVDLVASVVETADGKVGVVGHMAGQTQITIVAGSKTYLLVVTVNPLITGKIRVGAYEVDVQNASRTNWVNGDLVITYLDTNEDVAKSFTLPKPTMGRLLAVGGGGAGGQEPGARNDTYGLPGGGGAGGMVVNDSQDFAAATYAVVVGAGGVAPRTAPASATAGANGTASTVTGGGETLANALGGGGGGARSAGGAGGSGGGGSYSGDSKNGGAGTSGQGYDGGKGEHKFFGAGGGGAGGLGGGTGSYAAFYVSSKFTDPTSANVYLSGAGGAGKPCDITGEMLEYAGGGAGGVPRLYAYYYRKGGKTYYTNTKPTDQQKEAFDNGKYFWCEASDGKPGRDGYGDGGGGGSYYSKDYGPTFAGSGGNGVVIVRIPPYKTTVEDALKRVFADQPATVSGGAVTLTGDVTGPICIPDNLGAITVNLNGRAIVGTDGAEGDDITPGGDGQPALKIVPHDYDCESGETVLSVTGTGSLKGGNGGKGYPGGAGAAAVSAEGFTVNVADGIGVTAGEAGESYVQHSHQWVYTVEDGKIVATCVADGDCSYKTRKPFVAVSASDASYTALRYSKAELVNGITPVTGVVVAPERYVGRDGTDYPESTTPPTEQGAYTVKMELDDMTISSDFIITEPKPSQGSVYEAWKTAERRGRDVRIYLSATFAGGKAINDGNVLFLGSRCSAHSMAANTVEKSINALAKYADVRWYAYGSSDPGMNLVNQLTEKGKTVADGTVTLIGGNHFVHKEMMDDLYAELVEKKNIDTGYDLIILEFDGDLLCRDGASPYELVYSLPAGWTDEKAAQLRAAMSRYYAEERVVWIVPDVNQDKEDAGYTGEYPWTSNHEFIWQRAFLGATETEGYKCPLQKNYEDANSLVAYLQDTLVGHLFSNAIIKDRLADGLSITKVTPEMRATNGVWRAFEGGPTDYSYFDPRSKKPVTAKVDRPNDKDVTVTFDMREEQAWVCANNLVIGDDFRVVIDAALDGFFAGVDEGVEKATNDGDATFTFTDPNLDEDEDDYTIVIPKDSPTIKNVKLTPDYTAEDVVRIYDGKGTNIVVKPIAPTPAKAVIRYSLDEHGTYTDTLELTNVCDKTKVWFEITDKAGDFITVTNFATVTILPRVVVEQAEDATKSYDGSPLKQPAHSNVLSRAIAEAEKMYPGQGASAAGFVSGEGFANVPMTADSQQTEVGSHANTIDRDAVTVNEQTDKNNYVFIYLPGTLTVTPPLPMGIQAFPVEKFYDADATNITWVVTNSTGAVITDATISLREKGTDPWIPVADFPLYVDTTNVTVQVRAEKTGFTAVETEAELLIKPRPVTLVAGSAEKTYDGTPLTCDTFTVKEGTAPEYGFVKEEGVASVTMTDESTITDPGSVPNEISSKTAKPGTKLDRNYVVATEPGTLTVTPAAFTASAEPVEKFYDSTPTNIIVTVSGIPSGVTPTYEYSYSETEGFVPAADFTGPTNVSESAEVYCRVIIPGTTNTVHATATIKPRIVVSHAQDGSWPYDGAEHTQPESYEDTDAEAEKSKAKWGTDELLANSTGFVDGEGYAADLVMTGASKITLPGTQPNVIDQSADKVALRSNTKPENYELYYLDGELKVTPVAFTASADPVEKFYDSEPTNIIVTVSGLPDGVTPTYEYSYSETEGFVPAADFTGPTNVSESAEVFCRVIIPGTTNTVHATATIKPRIVVSHAKDGEWAFDGAEHKQPESYEDTDEEAEKSKAKWGTDELLANSTGFVDGEGYAADLVMTGASKITLPGTQPNVIDTAADKVALKSNTKAENYELYYLDGELKVTPATFTASADPVEKFYDSVPTNIIVTVEGIPSGVTPTYEYSYSETEGFVPAADFTGPTNVSESAEVYCRVIIPGTTNVVSATATIKPRIVVSHAKDGEWAFNGEAHVQPESYEDTAVEAEKSKAKWGTDELLANSTGFVDGEGYASALVMTDESRITLPGTQPNVIDQAADRTALNPNTKAENYELYYLDGELKVTPATFTASAEPVEKFYDSVPTNIIVTVSGVPAGVTPTYEYSYSETEGYVPASDFTGPTNVSESAEVYCRVIIPGTTNTVHATATIKPRIVVSHAKDGEWAFDGAEHKQPESYEDTAVEAEKSKAKWGTDELLANSTGFVDGEGYAADLVMTGASKITLPGTQPNVIDTAADKVALRSNTRPENYELYYLDGTLTVTPAAFTASADPVEKFYDSVPTNIIVTVAGLPDGVTPTYEYSYSETEGFVPAAEFTGPTNVSETAEIWCRVIIPGTTNTVHATATIKPRIVVSHAKDGEWAFDGAEHTQPESYEDTAVEAEKSKAKWGTDELLANSTGFVDGEGYADDLVMTGASRITLPGTQPNVIDQAADKTALKSNTKAENYELYYLDGELKVTPAAFTASAEPVEKFYDSTPTNIIVKVSGVPSGVTPTYEYSYSETEGFVPAAEFTGPTNVSETAEVFCRVIIPGTTNVVSATATIKPRIVVSHAKDGEWAFDGEEHAQPDSFEDEDAEAEKSKAKWGTDELLANSTGFVDGEGYASALVMTDGSKITLPGTQPNVIDTAADKTALKSNTKAENYEFYYLDGELKVTPVAFTASADPVEKFYDSVPTNITVTVAGIPSGVTPTYEYSYSETEGYVPASDFTGPTNVSESAEVYCRVIIPGTTNTVHATATIKPRIVVSHAKDGEWAFDGAEHKQPESYEDTAVEAEKSKAKWGTDELLANSTGFVDGEGYADDLVMTDASRITLPGTQPNVIDTAADKVVLKPNTKAENYELYYLDGELKVTPAAFTASADPVEKFYDSVPTNIIVKVSGVPSGVTPTYEYSYSETEGFVPAAEFTGPTNVSESAEVYCRVIIPGTTNTVHATATIKPRIVVSHAKDGSWPYDGAEHKQPESYEDTDAEAEKSKAKWGTDEALPDSIGFVEGEGYANDLVMTDASKITLPGTQPNVIDTAADKVALNPNTKAENYELYYLDGTLTVTPAAFTASAEPVEKFYDSVPTNIIVKVSGVPAGVTPTYEYSYSETEGFVPAADFTGPTNVSESAEVYCRVIIPGTTNTVHATATIKPRIVVSHAKDGSWPYDGAEHKQPESFEDTDAEAEKSKAKWGTDELLANSTGFVDGEGYANDLVMTDASRITLPGTQPNVIDTAADKVALKSNTKPENYELYYLDGTLTVTPAAFTASADPVEKFYDSAPTNIIVTVSGVPAGVTPTYEYSYSETEGYVPASDFTGPTNVSESAEVFCRVIIPGTTNVVSATATIKPRIVVSHAKDGEWAFDGEEHAQPDSFEDEDAEAEKSKAKWGTDAVLPDSTGFVDGEGYASALVMTDGSKITLPGTQPNVIDTAADKVALKSNTKPENYELYYLNGTLTVTPAAFTASAEPVEKFYDSTPTNIIVTVSGIPSGVTPTYEYSYSETEGFVPAAEFTGPTNVSETAEVYCRVIIPGTTNVVSAVATIKPRIVVQKAGDDWKYFDGDPLRCDDSEEKPERELEEAKKLYGDAGRDATGFVGEDGFATVPMTADSEQTDVGTHANTIDPAAVTLLEGTKNENYVFIYLPGMLEVIQREEEVKRGEDFEKLPEETKKAVRESDEKISEILDELVENDPKADEEPYIKYQLTVTPTNHLSEATRTTPEKAAEDAKKQVELVESKTGSKIDKVEFVDIVLERTYSKEEAEATAAGDYHKNNWEPLDKAEEHGNKLFAVVVPVEVPEGMELIGVTRSCDSKGTEILKPRDPNDPNAEGFVYDPETKTVTLYAYDFCVFGFMMQRPKVNPPPLPPRPGCGPVAQETAWVYQWKFTGKTTAGDEIAAAAGNCGPVAGGCAIRVPSSLRIQGYTYFCNPGCSTDFFPRFAKANEVFWQTRPWKASMAGGVATTIAHMIGRAHAKCEVAGTARFREDTEGATYVISYAGLGKMAVTDARKHISSVSGNFAGFVDQAWMVNGRVCKLAGYWDCTTLRLACLGPTVAYGKWSATYKSTASKDYLRGKTVQLPSWVKPLNKK